jgi:hypothetical protein
MPSASRLELARFQVLISNPGAVVLSSCEQDSPAAGQASGTVLFLKPIFHGRRPNTRPLMRRSLPFVSVIALICGLASVARAQQPEEQPAASPAATNGSATAPGIDPDALPVNIARIQRRLSRPAAIKTDSSRTVFRVEVFGRNPTIEEILGPNWKKGPTPYGGMTHQEFLNIVTPKDVQGYAAFDNKQAMVVAATSFALQWALRQAVKKLDDAKTARQKEAAQKEVEEALTALRKARRDAGLPDK